MEFPIQKPFFNIIFSYKTARARGIEEKQISDTNWIGTFPRPPPMNLSAFKSYHKQCPKHITNLNIGLCEISSCELAICPWNCQNATSATHPKTQLATHLKTQKLQRKCCVDASSRSFLATHLKWRKPLGNAPQNTNPVSWAHPKLRFGSWQRTWNYKTHLKSHCRLPCQHAAGMRIWETDGGRGTPPPPKKQVKGGKTGNQKKLRTNPDFGWAMNLKTKTHEGMVKEQKRTSAKQDRHQENEQHIWTSERQDSQQRNKGEQRKNDIIQNEQLATVVLKFKPQVADKSEIKSTTI